MKKILILILIFLHSLCLLHAQEDEDMVKTITFTMGETPKTTDLGDVIRVTYELRGNLNNKSDIIYPPNTKGFAMPIRLNNDETGNYFETNKKGKQILGHSAEYVFAIVPTAEGKYTLPRASVLVNGKKYEVEERTITVLAPDKPLRNVRATMEMPNELTEQESFDLKMTIEGDCAKSFTIYLPKTSGMELTGYQLSSKSETNRITKSKNKHEYIFRMRALKSGKFSLPNALIWIPADQTHFVSNSIKDITVSEDKSDILKIQPSIEAPKTVFVNKPFQMHYAFRKTRGKLEDVELTNNAPAGFDKIGTPVQIDMQISIQTDGNTNDYIYVQDILFANEMRATKTGKLEIPALTAVIGGAKYSTQSCIVEVLANDEDEKAKLTTVIKAPSKVMKNDEFDIKASIVGYSPYLESLEFSAEEYDKLLSKNFTILDREVKINERTASIDQYEFPKLSSENTYKWKVKAKKEGTHPIPIIEAKLDGNMYASKKQDIVVEKTINRNDISIKAKKAYVVDFPAEITIISKFHKIESIEFPDLASYGISNIELIGDSYSNTTINNSTHIEYIHIYNLTTTGEGDYALPPLLIKTEKGDVYSDSIYFRVLPADKYSAMNKDGVKKQMSNTSTNKLVLPSDIFIKTKLSKNKVYLNQAVYMEEKLYSSLPVINRVSYQTTELNSFHPEKNDIFNAGDEIKDYRKEWEMEHIDGRNFKVYDIRKTLLFPSETGKIKTITSNYQYSIYTDDSDGRVKWQSPDITSEDIEVLPLPTDGKPTGFYGLIGDFAIEASLSNKQTTVSDTLTLCITIKGDGNFNLLTDKVIDIEGLDSQIDITEAESKDDFDDLSDNGWIGCQKITYVLRVGKAGKYTIPAIELSYFDIENERYVTKTTKPLSFTVK